MSDFDNTTGHPTMRAFLEGTVLVAKIVDALARRVTDALREAVRNAEANHRRAALRRAYVRRRQWKKADLLRLESLDVNASARRRIERVSTSTCRGRGVVEHHASLGEHLIHTCRFFAALTDPATQPAKRLQILKHTTWWPSFAEALYRGEYEAAKAAGGPAPWEQAERTAAACLIVSQATLRKTCQKIRDERAGSSPDCAGISVAEFEVWKRTGVFPSEHTIKLVEP